MKRQFIVTVEMPEEATPADVKRYIHDAVQTWKGQLHPSDPMADLDYSKVRVYTIPKL